MIYSKEYLIPSTSYTKGKTALIFLLNIYAMCHDSQNADAVQGNVVYFINQTIPTIKKASS